MNSRVRILQEALPVAGTRFTAQCDITRDEIYKRLPFAGKSVERLAGSTVTIVGVGAGGSLLACQMARAGIGCLRLVDPDSVLAHNVIRHVANLEDVGRPKVYVIAEAVLRYNPYICVEAYPIDLFDPESPLDAESVFGGSNLIISATDSVSAQLQVNAIAWQMGIPGVFGGCFEEARGGEVLFTLPGEGTPCLACLRAGLALPETLGQFDYSTATNHEEFKGEPGFAAAVDLVTNIEAQVALALLLRGTSSALEEMINPALNYLLIGGALGGGYYRFKRPFHIFWQPLAGARPGCPVCQPEQIADAQG